MATTSVNKFCGPILLVIILQATRISALECYGCYLEPDCGKDNVPNKFIVTEASSNEMFQNQTKEIKEILLSKELSFTKGPYCVKWLQADTNTMFRYIMPEGPKASDLDESGCIWNQRGRICFCDQDKCNNGRILQFNEISALECYGCHVDIQNKHGQKDCLQDDPPAEFLVNQTSFKLQTDAEYWNMDIFKDIRMRPGPFCVKMSIKENDNELVFRNILPQAPEASYLDASGCMDIDGSRACFCNQDKCNNGPGIPPLQCYGCIVGADKELSEYNREDCLEVNPPDELLVNKTSVIPLFDTFAQSLTNYTVNKLKTTKGPFCVKVLHEEERFMFRYIMPVGVDTKYLDENGCMVIDDARQMCFCKVDKCNNGC